MQKPAAVSRDGFCQSIIVMREISVPGSPGSDLLFQALRLSTIGAEGFNGRVRYGNGFRPPARTTRSAKNGFASWFSFQCRPSATLAAMGMGNENDQDRTSY